MALSLILTRMLNLILILILTLILNLDPNFTSSPHTTNFTTAPSLALTPTLTPTPTLTLTLALTHALARILRTTLTRTRTSFLPLDPPPSSNPHPKVRRAGQGRADLKLAERVADKLERGHAALGEAVRSFRLRCADLTALARGKGMRECNNICS